VNSTGLPGSADNDRNPIKSLRSWRVIVNPRLTDTDAWFLVAGNKSQHGMTFYKRLAPTLEPSAKDPRTGNTIMKLRHRFSIGAWTWVGTYGSAGA
jgi:hypothetical protein